jgi:hypothetical protein
MKSGEVRVGLSELLKALRSALGASESGYLLRAREEVREEPFWTGMDLVVNQLARGASWDLMTRQVARRSVREGLQSSLDWRFPLHRRT